MPRSTTVIVVAGESLIDLVVIGDALEASSGGAPYNVARACGRLGAPTALLAVVSTDGFGQRLEAGLSAAGVSAALLQRTDRPTTLAVADLDAVGAATYRFYVDGTSAPMLSASALPDDASVLVTGGLGLVLSPMAQAIETVVLGAGEDVLVLVDVNCRPAIIGDRDTYLARLGRVLGRSDVVKVSDEDLDWLRPGVPPAAAAEDLLAAGVQVVLVTCGDRATRVVTAAGAVDVRVTPVPVVDTIGAGDAFTAGFVSWWRATGRGRADLVDVDAILAAVAAAHTVAAAVVTRRGADPPSLADLPPGWPERF